MTFIQASRRTPICTLQAFSPPALQLSGLSTGTHRRIFMLLHRGRPTLRELCFALKSDPSQPSWSCIVLRVRSADEVELSSWYCVSVSEGSTLDRLVMHPRRHAPSADLTTEPDIRSSTYIAPSYITIPKFSILPYFNTFRPCAGDSLVSSRRVIDLTCAAIQQLQ